MIALCLALPWPALATDIFGEAREFSLVANGDALDLRYGFEPLERLTWGLDLTLYGGESVAQNHIKVDEALVGLYCTYPVVSLSSLVDQLPAEGELFAGASVQWDTGTRDNVLRTFQAGADAAIDDNLSARVMYQFSDQSNPMGQSEWMLGIVARW